MQQDLTLFMKSMSLLQNSRFNSFISSLHILDDTLLKSCLLYIIASFYFQALLT